MARVALLIGTENYGTEFGRLEATPRNVHALAEVLDNPLMGGFDCVEKLIDPDHSKMGETIETWLRSRDKKDLILLYIAGHGVKDVARQLYFAASTSRKVEGELVTSTAVSAQNVQAWLRTSAKRQIVILDCCFSGAFGDLLAHDDGSVDVEAALGAEGRVVLTSSSSMQYSFQQREGELSVYTHHLIEGIRTGAADLDDDGKISTDELHEYTCRKVQEESYGMHPKIIVTKDEGYRLKVANTPLNDPLVKYRKEVEKIVAEDENEICEVFSRPYLEELQQKLEISVEIAQTIEDAVLEPIRQYQSKLQKYRDVIDKAIERGMYPFGDRETKRLKQLQNSWGLSEANASEILSEAIVNLPIPEQTVRNTQTRTSTMPQAIVSISEAAKENQVIVDNEVDYLIENCTEIEAVIVAKIVQSTDPAARLTSIIQQVAKQPMVKEGGDNLLDALNELRNAIAPGLRPATAEMLDCLFGDEVRSPTEEKIVESIWGKNQSEFPLVKSSESPTKEEIEEIIDRTWGESQPEFPLAEFSEVPLFKENLGGSSSSQPIESNLPKPIVYPTFKFEYATIDQNRKIRKHPGEAHYFREIINGVDFELVKIPAGSFEIGSNDDRENPNHHITVPEFFMGKYPVTQAQWEAIANLKEKKRKLDPDLSQFKGADRPIENILWEDAVEFCGRLSDHTGRLYRLPSEAEWEYACRAGTTTPYHFGETLDRSLANYEQKYKKTTTVGKFPGNPWGLFDCHGNVWEWCADVWHPNYNDAPMDGSPRITGANTAYHSGRGGSWAIPEVFARSASRYDLTRASHFGDRGFRLVLSVVGGFPSSKSPNSGGL
jgi:hypothetical protein